MVISLPCDVQNFKTIRYLLNELCAYETSRDFSLRCISDGYPILHMSLQWSHNGHDGVSNHEPYGCLLNHLFWRRSKITSKLRVTGLCEGNPPGTGEFPAQMASNAENVSIWWRHHVFIVFHQLVMKYCVNVSMFDTYWSVDRFTNFHENGFNIFSDKSASMIDSMCYLGTTHI